MFFFRGKNFSFELNTRTYVMGILNVTPDSFYDGGKWNSPVQHLATLYKCKTTEPI